MAVADGRPHYVLATTRFQDHLRTPGKPVFTVEREGATLLYLFEVRPPRLRALSYPARASSILRSRSEAIRSRSRRYSSSSLSSASRSAAFRRADW